MTAPSPGSAISRQLYWQARRPVAGLVAFVTLLSAIAHLPAASEWRNTVFLATSFLAFGWLFVLGIYALPGKDVLGPQSGFPDWMLVLPVRTRELVFWPMLHSCAMAILAWIVPTQWILRPLGVEPPLLWPGFMIAAMITWLQALLWSPFGLPYTRLLTLLVLLPALPIVGVNLALEGMPPTALSLGFGLLVPAAFALGVRGLAAARRGDAPEWSWNARSTALPRLAERQSFPIFRSAWAAQLWYEWRSSGLPLPLVTTTLCLLVSLPLFWVHELTPLSVNPPRAGFESLEINVWLRLQATFLLLPPLLAAILGSGRRRYDTARRDPSLHPFLSTRPVLETTFIGAKFRAAAVSTALSWAITLAFFVGWLLTPGRDDEMTAPTLMLLAHHCNFHTAVVLALVLTFLVFWTWKNQVQGLFADVSGRAWIVGGVPAVLHGCLFAGYLAWIQWCGELREVDLRYVPLPSFVPWLLGLALTAKGGAAALALRLLLHRALLSPLQAATWIGIWLFAALLMGEGLYWTAHTGNQAGPLADFLIRSYIPVFANGTPDALLTRGYLFTLSALFVPISRLLLAPAALHWNRHR